MQTRTYWATVDLPNGVHVVPIADVVEHDLDTHGCLCGPTFELGDSGRWLVIHHSLDGRERHE